MALAAVSATVLLLAVVAAPVHLAAASWPYRCPTVGLLMWQALGLAGGLLALELLLTIALSPYGTTHLSALRALLGGDGGPVRWWSVLAAVLWLLLLARLLAVLLRSSLGTLRARRQHRHLVDLVGTRNPLLPGARVVASEVPVAYCLPGMRARVVLSTGTVQALRDDELRAVLAHERAHVEQRHDLVVLPFLALGRTFPRLPAVRCAQLQVATLIEVLADDRAARQHSAPVLARALRKVSAGGAPAGGLGMAGPPGGFEPGPAGAGVLLRAGRLVDRPALLPRGQLLAALAANAAVALLPVVPLVVPLL